MFLSLPDSGLIHTLNTHMLLGTPNVAARG